VTAPFYPTVEAFQAAVKHFFEAPDQLVFGEETADEAYARFARAVTHMRTHYPQKTVIIITHGTVISLFVSRLFELAPYPFWAHLTLPSFVVLEHPPWQLQNVVKDIR
jgi:broad specificity phosphatase PhoE